LSSSSPSSWWHRWRRESLRGLLRPHSEISGDLEESRQPNPVYFLMLVNASLISLLGLLTNSPAVIIGAMLISPLMGPILSCGLGLAVADGEIVRKSLRNVVLSVVEAVVIAAVGTAFSPLRDATPEILARINPNLMDLVIAFLSGVAGALALTLRRSGLTILPGVAIATAVMPPLATSGYGLATGQWAIGRGGFMLFFTNLTAIVLSATVVFLLVGFRPRNEENHWLVRNRVLAVAGILAVVSIPLFRTLLVAAQQARTRHSISSILRDRLEKAGDTRITSLDFRSTTRAVTVDAVVQTSRFVDAVDERELRALLSGRLGKQVDLRLRQVRLRSDSDEARPDFLALAVQKAPPPTTQPPVPSSVVAAIQNRLEGLLDPIVSPVAVHGLSVRSVGQAEGTLVVGIEAQAPRPVDPQVWLVAAAALGREAGSPVRLEGTVMVFDDTAPPTRFRAEASALDPEAWETLRSRVAAAGARKDLSLEVRIGPAGGALLSEARRRWLAMKLKAILPEGLSLSFGAKAPEEPDLVEVWLIQRV
jgi:uncharacterized hydrophobic protein (TIGR00271 family)